jgi:hypothetical protein
MFNKDVVIETFPKEDRLITIKRGAKIEGVRIEVAGPVFILGIWVL